MRLFAFLTMCAALCMVFCGCVKHYQMLRGEKIEVLSPKEEQLLKGIARKALVNAKIFTAREKELIRTQKPTLKIIYTANRTGDATVSWKLPGKTVALFTRGTFFDPSSQWMMKVRDDHPEYWDFTGKTPRRVEKR